MASHNKKVRVAIVGKGLNSLGCLHGIDTWIGDNKLSGLDIEILHVDDSRSTTINFEKSSQINRHLGHLGTSKFWHAVTPISKSDSKTKVELFDSLYSKTLHKSLVSKIDDQDIFHNFIPQFRPKLTAAVSEISKSLLSKENCKIVGICDTVNKVIIKNPGYILETKSGLIDDIDVLFLTSSALDVEAIFPEIHELSAKLSFIDHDQIFFGLIEKTKIPFNFMPIRTGSGYLLPVNVIDDISITFRPWHSPKFGEVSLSSFQNFGKSKSDIIKDIFNSGSLAKLKEALSTKFGLFYNSGVYAVWGQVRTRSHPREDILSRQLIKIEDSKWLSQFVNLRSKLDFFKTAGYALPGNHIVCEAEKLIDDPLKPCILSFVDEGWLTSLNHTLSLMEFSSVRVQRLLTKKFS